MAAALDGFVRAAGRRHVVTGRQALGAAGRTTYATHQQLAAIVRPGTVAQVQAVLRVAHEHGVAIHPVSGGRNWGYGARVPIADGAVLLDLGRLDRIVGYEEELGSVTIEAGVTQAKLAEYLHAAGDRFRIDANGWADALRSGAIEVQGSKTLARALPTWNRRGWAADDPRGRFDPAENQAVPDLLPPEAGSQPHPGRRKRKARPTPVGTS